MQIRVQLFAGLKSQSGRDFAEIDVDEASTASDVKSRLKSALPETADLIQVSRLAVDQRYVMDDQPIDSSAGEFALIPPVSGG